MWGRMLRKQGDGELASPSLSKHGKRKNKGKGKNKKIGEGKSRTYNYKNFNSKTRKRQVGQGKKDGSRFGPGQRTRHFPSENKHQP